MNRLFSIIQTLRAAKQPVRAKQLSEELEVSLRTVYRDIAELQMQGVPISGEAGIGYILKPGFDLPPLMLTADELEAAWLGAQWVIRSGDAALAKGARTLIEKINTITPRHLQHVILNSPAAIPTTIESLPDAINMVDLRNAIRDQKKIGIVYRTATKCSNRIVWPIVIAYFETVRVLAAWCESKNAFRHFRTDRIEVLEVLEERYPKPKGELINEWWAIENSFALRS